LIYYNKPYSIRYVGDLPVDFLEVAMGQEKTEYALRVLAVLTDRSAGWRQDVRCEGYLNFGRTRESLKITSPGHTRFDDGYLATFKVVVRGDRTTILDIKQTFGDRTMITIRRMVISDGVKEWDIVITRRSGQEGPFKMIMYPGLEQLLEDLISFP
jgi:hypothetical protein